MTNPTEISKAIVEAAIISRGFTVWFSVAKPEINVVQAFSVETHPGTMGHPKVIAEIRNGVFSCSDD